MKAELVPAEVRIFPDGESKTRLPKVSEVAVVVQSTYPPADTHLLQALMMARKCADDGAEVCAVVPYLAYSRQDRPFLEGETVTISLVEKLLAAAGVSHLITIDMHSRLGMSYFKSVSIESISSIPLLAEYAKISELRDPIAVSPDTGGTERVKDFAARLGWQTLILRKSRDRATGDITVEDPGVDFKGRDAVLVDDMISSGGSIVKGAQMLRQKGAAKVVAMCAHALLLGDAASKIANAGVTEIIATNSIPNEYAKVDLSESIAGALSSRYHD